MSPLPPVLDRELRQFAKKKRFYNLRSLVALLAFAAVFIIEGRQTNGRASFLFVLAIGFVISQTSGAWLTASALIDERRQGTLALLFITPLRPAEIILTKLASQMAVSLSLLLALIPAAAVMVLAGGITGLDLGLSALALINLSFWSLAVGLAMAAYSKNESQPSVGTLALLLLAIVPPPVAHVLFSGTAFIGVEDVLNVLCPPMVVPLSLRITDPFGWTSYVCAMVVTQGQAWILIAAAGKRCRESVAEPVVAAGPGFLARSLHRLAYGGRKRRVKLRRLLRSNPATWLVQRNRTPAVFGWALVVAMILVELGLRTLFGFHGWTTTLMVGMAGIQLFKLIMATAAVERTMAERSTGGLELLLTSPLRLDELKSGFARGLDLHLLPPYLAAFSLGFLWLWIQCLGTPSGNASLLNQAALSAAGFWFVFGILGGLELMAVSALGLAAGLVKRRRPAAMFRTFLGGWLLPGVLMLVALMGGRALDSNLGGVVVVGVLAVVGSAITLAVGWAELHLALERVRRHSPRLRRSHAR